MFGIWFGLVIVPSSILLLALGLYWYLGTKENVLVQSRKKGSVAK